ncbi:hypothetical protein O181_107651 [Austropuccinia psidii MF-1]|uniref:Uncharacterized protein n=1 Tax=Austropuccinia psidii MF-1 TaxID=1389203 RepID=A0A9Q3PPB1_9BASI|nr:hypothetical protein [Austropuccinia psidii MF-1]
MTDIFCVSIKTTSEGHDTVSILFKGYNYIINFTFPPKKESTTPAYTPPTSVNCIDHLSPILVNSPLALGSYFGTSPNNSPSLKIPPPSYFSPLITMAFTNTDTSSINQNQFNQLFECFDTGFLKHAQDFHQYFREAQTSSINTPCLLCLRSSLSTLMDLYNGMSKSFFSFFTCIY